MDNRSYIGSITKYDEIGIGSFSRVYLAEYFESTFAYKELLCDEEVIKKIMPNLEKLTHIEEKGLVLPYALIYKKRNVDLITGYVMDYLYNYDKLSDLSNLSYDKKVKVLKDIRKTLENFHEKYKMLHGDIAPWNIMYNEKKDESKLIDFDLSIDLTKKDLDEDVLSLLASIYKKNNSVDKDLDMFLFNLTTYSFLNNKSFFNVIGNIQENNFGVIENNHAIKILEGYKDIEFDKVLKKEYVIDYL